MSQIRFAPCPGCLALSQDQRYAAYLARVQPHCGYQYQAPWCASGVWTRHWLPLVSSSRHWLSNGFPMLILIQLLSNGYPMVYEWLVKGFQWLSNGLPMVFQFSNGYPMVSQWIYLNIHGFPWVPMGSHWLHHRLPIARQSIARWYNKSFLAPEPRVKGFTALGH